MRVTTTLKGFIESEKSGGLMLIICTLVSLLLANSTIHSDYENLWQAKIGTHSLEHWINDGLMTVFFLLVGLELIQEVYEGELSKIKTALLPLSGALGGMLVPATIYILLNYNAETFSGFGIPMATDIAFALGILSLLGNRVPLSLKIFLTALAVIDDLGAIIVIAIFYTTGLSWAYLLSALGVFVLLLIFNKVLNIKNLILYLLGGILMWYCMLNSGIHATIAGVLLAITIPFKKGDKYCLSNKVQRWLHYPVAFFILPLFALANTAIFIEGGVWDSSIGEPFALGIIFGLLVGKPLGIFIFSFISVKLKLCTLPKEIKWKELLGVGMLGGIGFTMSIFITLLAFNDAHYITESKLMILFSSTVAGVLGYTWLNFVLPKKKDNNE